MSSTDSPVRGPVRAGERALAPDLARGFMLLLIALANTPWYLWGSQREGLSIHPAEGSVADTITQGVIITGVDMRVYPMFAFLFGYGIVQLFNRQLAGGTPERSARGLLRRRHWWMVAIGFAHAALLWMGDIIGTYGVVGLVMCWLFLRRSDRALLIWAGIGTALLALFSGLSVVGAVVIDQSGAAAVEAPGGPADMAAGMSDPSYLATVGDRLSVWLFLVPYQGFLSLAVPVAVLLGFWAARRRVLEEPGRHLRLLTVVAVGGIGIGWLSGLPYALQHAGWAIVPAGADWVFSIVHVFTGLLAGIGYIALFGLIAHRLSARASSGVAVTAITALGKRSMSGYLAQSVVCAPLLAAWGLGLGGSLGSLGMAAFAVGLWLLTVAGAYALERTGRRGPAEVLLRRLAYPATGSRSKSGTKTEPGTEPETGPGAGTTDAGTARP